MTYENIPGETSQSLENLSSYPLGSKIRCIVVAEGVGDAGEDIDFERITDPVTLQEATTVIPPRFIENSLSVTLNLDGNGQAEIQTTGDLEGTTVVWETVDTVREEGDVTLTYSIEYEDFRLLGTDVYRTDDYAWTVRSASGLPIEHGTFIDGTPWVIDTGDLQLIDVTPREREITTTDFKGNTATGITSRTVINPDFCRELSDQSFGPEDPPPFVFAGYEYAHCRAEGETNPGAAATWTEDLIPDRKSHPFDFRAGAGREQRVSRFGNRYDPTQAIDLGNLVAGIPLRAGDMVVTQTGLDESNLTNRPFDGSYGTLTVMSPKWEEMDRGTEEYYRPPVNWDGFNETLRAERSVMALKREVRWYENPITPPEYDYNSDTKTWTDVYLNGGDRIRNTTDNGTDPIKIKNPGMIFPFFYISDPGGNEGNGVKNLAMTWDTYANRGSKDEEAYLLCTFDPAVDFELRKKFYDIMVQRGIDWWGKYYALGYRLKANGGHNPEYGPKLFYAWCATQDSRIFDCLNFETGNVHNGTKKYMFYEPDVTGYPYAPALYHEFGGDGLGCYGCKTGGARHFNLNIVSVDTTPGTQSITIRRPETAARQFIKRREYGEPIPPTDIIEFTKSVATIAEQKLGPYDQATNSAANSIRKYWTGGIISVNGQTTRVVINEDVFYDYATDASFGISENIDGIQFEHVHILPENNYYRKFFSMDKVAFKDEGEVTVTIDTDGDGTPDTDIQVQVYSLHLIFQENNWKIDKWLSNEQGQYRVSVNMLGSDYEFSSKAGRDSVFNHEGDWVRTGRILKHESLLPESDIEQVKGLPEGFFTEPLTVFENWTSWENNPEEMTLYLQTDILNDGDTFTTCDYANISKEEAEAGAFLRHVTRGPSNCSTQWGQQSYAYSHCAHTLSIHLAAQEVGGFDVLPKWGQLLWERNKWWATTVGLNVRIHESDAYQFRTPIYLATMRQRINDGVLIQTPPAAKDGGMTVIENWRDIPLPDQYTIEEVNVPDNVTHFSSYRTSPTTRNPVWIYNADGSKYAYLETITQEHPSDEEIALGANPMHRRIVFDNSKAEDLSPIDVSYEFFVNHDFYVLAHDSTNPVPLTQTFTNAESDDDIRFKVWFRFPDGWERVTKYGESCILICERS